MLILKAIILGIIEGITEFLPISSTGHLIIANNFVGFPSARFENAFNIIIQLGAILSVVFIYFDKLNPFSLKRLEKREEICTAKLSFKEKFKLALKAYDKRTMSLWIKIIVGVLPAMILGLLLDDYIDAHFFSTKVVAINLIFYGLIIIWIESSFKKKAKFKTVYDVGFSTCFLIGLFQCLAMIPGTSRSAATIIGAMLLGLSRTAAAEFSFFLAIPTMLGATLLKMLKLGSSFSTYQFFIIFIGGLVSFIVALVVIRSFMRFVKRHSFKPFGYYRILLGLLLFVLMLMGVI